MALTADETRAMARDAVLARNAPTQMPQHTQRQATQVQADTDTGTQQQERDLEHFDDEREQLVAEIEAVQRERPRVEQRVSRLREIVPGLEQAATDAGLLARANLPQGPAGSQQEAQAQLHKAQTEMTHVEAHLAHLMNLEQTLPPRLAQLERDQARLLELKQQDAARRAAVLAERAAVLAPIQRAAAQLALACVEAGRFNWRHRLLEMPDVALLASEHEHQPEPPTRFLPQGQRPRPAADAMCAPILWSEILPAQDCLCQLPLLFDAPSDFMADAARWGQSAQSDAETEAR